AARDAARSIIEGIFGAISSDTLTKGELDGLIGDFSVGDFKGFLDELLGLIPDALDESGEQLATASERWADAVRNIGRASEVFGYTIGEQAQAIVNEFGA